MPAATIVTSIIASKPKPFSAFLSGRDAFYSQANYEKVTEQEFSQSTALPSTYIWNTEYKVIRLAKMVFSILIFPIGLYYLLHSLAGRIILLASGKSISSLQNLRPDVLNDKDWKYKRLTIEVDGYKIDAVIAGKRETLANGRWVVVSGGNNEAYEETLTYNHELKSTIKNLNANAVFFNYPSVGASSGLPNREAMAKAYRAILTFLEDKERGIGAHEIIGYGHSIGGAVQADALLTHKLKEGIKYLFVKSRTFSNLADLTLDLTKSKFLKFLVKILHWNMDSVKSSQKLQAREIILQTAFDVDYEVLLDNKKISYDGLISKRTALAEVLLERKEVLQAKKVFIGMRETHNDPIRSPDIVARIIEENLRQED